MFRPPRPVSVSLNLAPMVDVMMCLIIFFLLASKIIDAEHQPVELAYAQAAEAVDRSEIGARVVINIRPAADQPDQAEYVVNEWDGKNILERVLIPAELNPYLAARAARAGPQVGELRCVIRADREVRYQHVEAVLRACGLAKLSKIVFSANEGVDPREAVRP